MPFPAPTTRLPLLLALALCAGGCSPSSTQLERIVERGELRIATRNGPTTYFTDRDGETGIEYEMAALFAEKLGVRLRVVAADNIAEVIRAVKAGEADLAAAALPTSALETAGMRPGTSYHWVTQQLVYRQDDRRPESLADVAPDTLHLAQGIFTDAHLAQLKREHPALHVQVHGILGTSELLGLLEAGHIRYTVVPSNELAHARQIHPEIRAAVNVSQPEPLAWAFPGDPGDRSLLNAANAFMRELDGGGELGSLLDHFYGPVESFDYVDSREFLERFEERLPGFRPSFEAVAGEFDVDWRLLAAIAYQESHWNPNARSPTGVRGLMMLTSATARRMGVEDRLDPEQSLRGGAAYLLELKRKIPERIAEPDRTWFALAAYNVGFGHLEDARILTQRQGGNADRWDDVRERLPLLANRQWYKDTRHGYARGYEPVKFVRRIRRYYTVLLQLTQPEDGVEQRLVETETAATPLL
jgi:membrane-bound lytic murein transglycosylase F